MPLDNETKKLIRDMHQTCEGKGIGLAAPQVGVSKHLCIIRLDRELATKKDKVLNFVMINPEVVFFSDARKYMTEGCLSFPGEYYEIDRPSNIKVRFWGITNYPGFLAGDEPKVKEFEIAAKGWMSRVIQHEVDHLNGQLFINLGGKKLTEDSLDGREVIDWQNTKNVFNFTFVSGSNY